MNGLSIDTRTLKEGDLFVALKGDNRDGHDFVRAAFAAKAGAALVSRKPEGARPAADRRQYPARPGRSGARGAGPQQRQNPGRHRQRRQDHHQGNPAPCLECGWAAPMSRPPPTTIIGACRLSLAGLPPDAEYGVFEIGMNHFGEIRDLVSFVRPHVALITTIAPAHLEFFGNCEAIADAKSEIFEGLMPGGAALIPADSPYADRLAARAAQAKVSRLVRFGRAVKPD